MIKGYLRETPVKMQEMLNNHESYQEVAKELLDNDIQKIIITGSGTSYHGGLNAVSFLEKVTGLKVEILYPFMINEHTFNDHLNTLLIGISQDGGSFSTYNAMKLAKEMNQYTMSMSGYKDVYIDMIADYIMTVPCGPELAGAKTKGFHCTILNIMLLGLQFGLQNHTLTLQSYQDYLNRIEKTVANMSGIIESSIPWIESIQAELAKSNDVRLVGTKDNYGNCLEGALKLLETIRCPVTGYEFEEFIHGIYNAFNQNSTLIVYNSGRETERLNRLVEVLLEWTDHIYVIGKDIPETKNNFKYDFINDEDFSLFEYVLVIEMMCAIVPIAKGIDPSTPMDPLFHQKLSSKKF